ncbi:hypothetical protein BKA83DRAFT_20332 [Pisolithus microcarpus]|nr:hypothetical protein BKA83DRAFT_20332 [Pisolithus microcarpus]
MTITISMQCTNDQYINMVGSTSSETNSPTGYTSTSKGSLMPYHTADAPNGRTETTSARTMDGPKTRCHILFGKNSPDRTPETSGGICTSLTSVVARLTSSLHAALLCLTAPR